MRRLLILVAIAAGAALLIWLWMPVREGESAGAGRSGDPEGDAGSGGPGSPSGGSSPTDPNAPLPGSLGAKPMDPRAAHQALVTRIRNAIARRKAEIERQKAAAPEVPSDEAVEPEISQEDLQIAINGALPSLTLCYQAALTRNPTLGGRVRIHFTVIADPEVGGIVESAEADDTQLREKDEQLVSCMNDAIYAMEKLPNPKGSGELEVVMPIVLQADSKNEP